MTKKNGLLILVVLVMAGVYVVYFTDWFKPRVIHVVSTNQRATRATAARANNSNPGFIQRLATLANSAASADPATVPVIFKMSKPYKLTDLKVVDLDQMKTNKNSVPLWHLVAGTNSVPIDRQFNYGANLTGMKPAVPGARAQPLNPGVKYRLIVTDGSATGEHDFTPVAKPEPAAP